MPKFMPERMFKDKEIAPHLEWIHILSNQLSYATELAAIAAARTAGKGEKRLADYEAVKAMRDYLNVINIKGTIVIGEGERDEADMLFIGEKVGTEQGPEIDIAVDPLENTNATAVFGERAISVLAASEKGGLLNAPDIYMNKLVVGPKARGRVSMDFEVKRNIAEIASSLEREESDLTIVVLDRERNNKLIDEIRESGARVRLITDGDLLPGVETCIKGAGIHALMGIGAAPEGVITAAAVKALNGEMQARFWPSDEKELEIYRSEVKGKDEKVEKMRAQLERFQLMGGNFGQVYRESDLASGNKIIFSATAVTIGDVMKGVRFFGGGVRTDTLQISMIGDKFVQIGRRDWIHGYDKEHLEIEL